MHAKKHLAMAAGAVALGLGAAFLIFKGGALPISGGYRTNATGPERAGAPPSPQARASGRPATFVSQAASSTAADDATPGSPSYRPQKYLRTVGLKTIFEREARDEPWAAPVEKYLGAAVAKDVAFTLRLDPSSISAECRTTACRLSFPSGTDMSRVQEIMRIAYVANGSVTDHDNRTHYVLYSGTRFDPHGDPDNTVSEIRSRRDGNLRAVARRNPVLLNIMKLLRPEDFPAP
jgi:hypothetical protein